MTRKLNDDGQESILQEAHRLTHGDRNSTYGHPYDDYTCTAAIATAILGDTLNRPITAHQMALIMCAVKLSRESRIPKRDNLVDLAGYAWVARMCHEEAAVRASGDHPEIVPAGPPAHEPEVAAEPPHLYIGLCWCGQDHYNTRIFGTTPSTHPCEPRLPNVCGCRDVTDCGRPDCR